MPRSVLSLGCCVAGWALIAPMSAQAQTRRTMSTALALLEDLVESIDGEQKERLSQTIAELEAIENELGGER